MKEDIEQLQQVITYQTMGVFWISQKKLVQCPRPFYALDYFLDGLLLNYCLKKTSQQEMEDKSFFVSNHFGTPFFLGHFDTFQDRSKEILDHLMRLVRPFKTRGASILVLDFSRQGLCKYLSSKYSDFKFKGFDLME